MVKGKFPDIEKVLPFVTLETWKEIVGHVAFTSRKSPTRFCRSLFDNINLCSPDFQLSDFRFPWCFGVYRQPRC
jgi:hypothetical protein